MQALPLTPLAEAATAPTKKRPQPLRSHSMAALMTYKAPSSRSLMMVREPSTRPQMMPSPPHEFDELNEGECSEFNHEDEDNEEFETKPQSMPLSSPPRRPTLEKTKQPLRSLSMHSLMYYREPSSHSLMLPPQEFDELSEASDFDDESDAVTFAGMDQEDEESEMFTVPEELNESGSSHLWGDLDGTDSVGAMLADKCNMDSILHL